jgi:hypothetical protein
MNMLYKIRIFPQSDCMKKLGIAALLVASICSTTAIAQNDQKAVIGRWDLNVMMGNTERPSWLEVKLSGFKTLVGYFVAEGGSARPVSHIIYKDGKINFSIPTQWDGFAKYMELEATVENDKLTGVIKASNGNNYNFTGERAPLLKRTGVPVWGKTINLIPTTGLTGWKGSGTNNQWEVIDGVLTSKKSGVNLITEQTFEDFKLQVEFRYPAGSNSGVYLRGRYEVQVEDNKGLEPSSTYFGGIYGFLTPNEMVAKSPGEWQRYEITLIGRRVTVVANGKTIIYDQIIPGITGGALDSKEALPGPIMLQGDHGPIEYRNMKITPVITYK